MEVLREAITQQAVIDQVNLTPVLHTNNLHTQEEAATLRHLLSQVPDSINQITIKVHLQDNNNTATMEVAVALTITPEVKAQALQEITHLSRLTTITISE